MTTTERWQRLSPYLEEALQIGDATERTRWLAALRARDPAVAADLELLLEEHRALEAEGFLEWRPAPVRAAAVGDEVGPYRLMSRIGEGGMGAVWLAERSDGRFDRRVAVKFLSVALTGRGEERFKREGRILARLSHPHVAQLVDAGVADDGRPFLVLEYVDGEAIDRYCENQHLDVAARLRVFLAVLDAVAHAHANLIVHRDIKPPNVLVDRQGRVKLLDFGVAKLLEDEGQAGEATQLTRDGGVGLTPEYAAPEQLTNAPVTTATDVYALGVLLYMLLTGVHPAGDARKSPADLMKAIVDTDPRRASDVGPERMRRALRGDLDTIIAKALKKNPGERYSSVTVFADDIRRYLRHEPIGARPDTLTYRAAKFIRRNWIAVAAAIAVIAALTTGLVIVNRERLVAERRFDQLRQLSNKVFELDHEIRNLPGSTQARQRLVSVSLEYLEGLAHDVNGDLDLAREVSDAYYMVAKVQGVPTDLNLGSFTAADQSLAKAQAFNEMVLAARPRDRHAVRAAASIAHDRMILADSESRHGAELLYAHTALAELDLAVAGGGWSESERSTILAEYSNIALSLINMHLYDDAVPVIRRAIDQARTLGRNRYRVAGTLSLLANALRYKGDLEGAYQAILEARPIAEQAAYPDPTFKTLGLYGVLLREAEIEGEDGGVSLGKNDDAINSFQAALDMNESLARRDPKDATSRSRVGTAGRELGNVLRHRDPQRALQVYDTAIARLSEMNNVKALRDRAMTLAESASPLRRLDRRAEATQRIAAALDLLKQTKDLPAQRLTLDAAAVVVLRAQAQDLVETGKPALAVDLYRDLVDKVSGGPSNPHEDLRDAKSLTLLYAGLSKAYAAAGDHDAAGRAAADERAIWTEWERKLPGNAYIAREIRALSAASPEAVTAGRKR